MRVTGLPGDHWGWRWLLQDGRLERALGCLPPPTVQLKSPKTRGERKKVFTLGPTAPLRPKPPLLQITGQSQGLGRNKWRPARHSSEAVSLPPHSLLGTEHSSCFPSHLASHPFRDKGPYFTAEEANSFGPLPVAQRKRVKLLCQPPAATTIAWTAPKVQCVIQEYPMQFPSSYPAAGPSVPGSRPRGG